MGCRAFLQCITRLINVLIGTLGIVMVLYSLWMLKQWEGKQSPSSLSCSLHKNKYKDSYHRSPLRTSLSLSLLPPGHIALQRPVGILPLNTESEGTDSKWGFNTDGILQTRGTQSNHADSSPSSSSSSWSSYVKSTAHGAEQIRMPIPDFKKLPAAWFIYAIMGAGVFTFLVAFSGLIATDCDNTCCLSFYIFGLALLLVAHGSALAFVHFHQVFEKSLPQDPTGELGKVRDYLNHHNKLCLISAANVFGLELIALVLSIILRVKYGGGGRRSCSRTDASIGTRTRSGGLQESLLPPQTQSGSVDNHAGAGAEAIQVTAPAGIETLPRELHTPPNAFVYQEESSVIVDMESASRGVFPPISSTPLLTRTSSGDLLHSVSAPRRAGPMRTSSLIGPGYARGGPLRTSSLIDMSARIRIGIPTDGLVLVTRRATRLVRDSIWVINNYDWTVRACLHNKRHEWCYHKEEISPGSARPLSCSSLRSVSLFLHLMDVNGNRDIPVYTVSLSKFTESMRPGASANSIMVSLSQVKKWESFTAESRFLYHYSFAGGIRSMVETVDDPFYEQCVVLNGIQNEGDAGAGGAGGAMDMATESRPVDGGVSEALEATGDAASTAQTFAFAPLVDEGDWSLKISADQAASASETGSQPPW